MDMILQTERLYLRRQCAGDIPFLVELWSDPGVTRWLGGPRERDWLQSVFEETARDPAAEEYDLWPLAERSSGLLTGHCGLLEKDVDGETLIELNYMLHPAFQGRGYAVEIGRGLIDYAFAGLKLPQLIALIHPENEPSAQVARRIGMHLAGEILRPGNAIRLLYRIDNHAS